jgi:hypothetical protein
MAKPVRLPGERGNGAAPEPGSTASVPRLREVPLRASTMLLVTLVAVGLSVAIWRLTGGHVAFFFLPLLFGLPFLGRRRG